MMHAPFERNWSQPFIDDDGGGVCSLDDGKIKITTIPYYIIQWFAMGNFSIVIGGGGAAAVAAETADLLLFKFRFYCVLPMNESNGKRF